MLRYRPDVDGKTLRVVGEGTDLNKVIDVFAELQGDNYVQLFPENKVLSVNIPGAVSKGRYMSIAWKLWVAERE